MSTFSDQVISLTPKHGQIVLSPLQFKANDGSVFNQGNPPVIPGGVSVLASFNELINAALIPARTGDGTQPMGISITGCRIYTSTSGAALSIGVDLKQSVLTSANAVPTINDLLSLPYADYNIPATGVLAVPVATPVPLNALNSSYFFSMYSRVDVYAIVFDITYNY